jgi:hypothetical protein
MKKSRGGKRAPKTAEAQGSATAGRGGKAVYSAGRSSQLLDASDSIIVHLNIQNAEEESGSCDRGQVNPYDDHNNTAFQTDYAYLNNET